MAARWDPLEDPLAPHLSIDGDGWTVGDDTGPQPRVRRCRRRVPLVWVGVLLIWAVLIVAALLAAPAVGDIDPLIRTLDRACRCGLRPSLEETP